jgi:predicted nucleic acid-binding protein
LFAIYDRSDADHGGCRELIEQTREHLIIPAPVLVEIDQLGTARVGPQLMLNLLDEIEQGVYQVLDLVRDDLRRINELLEQYADSRIGFVDAAVLAIVERLNEPKLATLDRRHFGILRPRHVESLNLLPA